MSNKKVLAILALGVLAVSSAGVLVRAAGAVDFKVIAFWRMALTAGILSPFLCQIRRQQWGAVFIAGLLLGLHFMLWFYSLQLIPIMVSTLLVTVAPVWAGLLEWVIHKQPPASRFWLGVLVALPGIALMSTHIESSHHVMGYLCATLAGMAGAGYFFIGNRLRSHISLVSYTAGVCGVAAVALLPVVCFSESAVVGFATQQWLMIVLLVLIPQLIGHSGLNYALKYLPASKITAATLFEPCGAGLLAWVCLGQPITVNEWIGAIIVISGLWLALKPEKIESIAPSSDHSLSVQ